jgi:predicted dehydrogenase
LHLVWGLLPNVDVVGLADPDPEGRSLRAEEAGAQRSYTDYREMLEKERPDFVSIGPRWTIHHEEYLVACAEVGAHGLLEKPIAVDLAEADRMIQAIRVNDLRWAIAFNFRASPIVEHTRRLVTEEGLIGEILEVRSRGKEDRRAGGEDLIVLGTHVFDMMIQFLGRPLWC